jgi:tellurium resistance protein TerD
MAIKLSKGASISLAKDSDSLRRVRVVLDWEAPDNSNMGRFDLDAQCFGLVKSEIESGLELFEEDYFVFYKNLSTDNKSIVHSGDDKDGSDGETITVDLTKIPDAIDEITFFVTIHKAFKRKQSFGQVKESVIRLFDDIEGDMIAEYHLNEMFTDETTVQFGTIYRSEDGWDFKAIGHGDRKELADILYSYGIEVE